MTRGFEARLHGPGLPDAGAPTRAEFAGGRLRVGGEPPDIDAAQLAVDAGGFNQDDVVLTWSDGAGSFALMISSAEAKSALLASAPAVLSRQLRRWNRGVTFTRTLWRTVIAVAAIGGVSIVLGIWQYDRVVAWTAAHISPENERRLGQSVMSGVRSEGRLVEKSAALDAIREIGGKLTQGASRKYEWYLKDDPSVNAFAIPGGFVVVHTGLVHAAASADELAGVLAHEVQHVEQRHALQGLLYQLGWATLLTVVLGDPSAITTLLLLEVGNLKFNRDLEAQADAGGVEALRRAGIPPEGLADFFRKLGKDAQQPEVMAWLSTHPATDDRVAAVEAAVKAAPCDSCKPLPHDWAAVRESLYRDGLIRRPAS